MASKLRVCPVILAGGQSRRMGRDKAQLQVPGGQTLLQRAWALLEALPPLRGMEFLPVRISGAATGGVADVGESRGPVSGLHAVAERVQSEQLGAAALLAIPVDMPLLQPEQLIRLCAAGCGSPARALCFGRYWLPLWLRLDACSRDYLRGAAQTGGDPSLRALVASLDGTQIEPPPGNWHWNVNRPQEFNRAMDCIAPDNSEIKRESDHVTRE